MRFFVQIDKTLITSPQILICDNKQNLNHAYQETGTPIIYPLEYAGKNYYTATIAFLRLYDFMVYKETKSHTKEIKARMYSDRIVLEIEFEEGGD